MCCGPLPGCLIHIKAPAIIYIMSLPPLPAAPHPTPHPLLPSIRTCTRMSTRTHVHGGGAGLHSCTDGQALTQTVTHNDTQRHKNSQSSHIRAETKVRRWSRPPARPGTRTQILSDHVSGHTTTRICFLRLSLTHPRNCLVSFSSPHSFFLFFPISPSCW